VTWSPATRRALDAVVVGSGPNGLAAAIDLARAGRSVHVIEAADTLGGGIRTSELTLPGFRHDLCSTVVPLAAGSPFFRSVDLARHGLEWAYPPVALAHLLRPERAVLLHQSLDATVEGLGRDGTAWARLLGPLAREWDRLADHVLGPPIRFPRHPLLLARFGLPSLLPGDVLPRLLFREPAARALFTGIAAHSMVRLSAPLTSAFGIVLATLAHRFDWPLVRGGIGRLADALVAEATELGVTFETGHTVASLAELPPSRAVVLDVTPRQVLAIARDRLPAGYRRGLERYRYGPGVFKVDWALDGPVPWRDHAVAGAGTVHLSGSSRAIAAAEDAVARGHHPERPFILFVQPTVADPTRAPAGKHIAWAYCHVPNGSTVDMTNVLEGEVERHAPGFRDLILARSVKGPAAMEAHDANYVGGDINGGIQDLWQALFRPVVAWDPYATPLEGLFLCSSSTPPGGGVHGMSGRHAARSVLRRIG
jgi:phytoene dehydrogenase-like protein